MLFRLAMQDTVARAQLNLLNSKVKRLSNTQIPARLEHQGLKSSQSTLIASHMGMSPHHMTSWLCLILILCWKSTLAPPKMHLSKRSKELLWKISSSAVYSTGKVKAALLWDPYVWITGHHVQSKIADTRTHYSASLAQATSAATASHGGWSNCRLGNSCWA